MSSALRTGALFAVRSTGSGASTMPDGMDTEAGLVTYCLLALVVPIMKGTPRREASKRSWNLLTNSRMMTLSRGPGPAQPEHGTNCVALVCDETAAILDGRVPFDWRRNRIDVPASVLPDCLIAVHLVQRVMLGEQPGAALRNAIDAAAGREPRHRAPLPDADVFAFTSALTEKLKRSLDKVWAL